jgi:hypothetical protein
MSDQEPSKSLDSNSNDKLLNDRELTEISGGADRKPDQSPDAKISHRTAGDSSSLEPGPTFPTPPYSEDIL